MINENGETVSEAARLPTTFQAYGCRCNELSPEELFSRYEQAGFLYQAKLGQLAPYLPLVRQNWRKALRAGELVLYVVTHQGSTRDEWASVSAWRNTRRGFQAQHLVSTGGPMITRAVVLGIQATRLHDGCDDQNLQSWFRPENRFPARVFGSLPKTIGPENSTVVNLNLLSCPVGLGRASRCATVLSDRRNGRASGLAQLAETVRGKIYVKAEELDQDDLLLEATDELYAQIGLRRYRRVWLAIFPGCEAPVGAAIAYRGPLGFNFSFLENRCELLLSPALTAEQVSDVTLALLNSASVAYRDLETQSIPVVVDDRSVACVMDAGGRFVRRYSQSIWLRDGFPAFCQHVEKFYTRIRHANRREGLGGRASSLSNSPLNPKSI